ncbi:2-dehydro-3-deoxygluconokinase [Gillisia mitskevichiae]|uniref:2-dehydro-3-deoxygluconokinase n=1 Tax=Gillisia mitskevichiae TaxID=270921 RepID=A0A495PYE4_9FLAO|nr:sugar kinase [Gillisia mitskevichiae]RKS55717.1 2-dehydro-3-deoxygluconokinase [Gillisia mitskevichiae]
MKNIVAFGEILMRLSPPDHLRFFQANTFETSYSGAEFNTLVSLQNWGLKTQFVTKLPDNDFGDKVLSEISRYRVGQKHIVKGGDRLGIYFLEKGSAIRSGKVIYDRAESAIANVKTGDINWEKALKGVEWFHWSGITPGISEAAAQECLLACKTARSMNIKISCDLNYRKTLWKWGKRPDEVLPEILALTNVILADLATLFKMLGRRDIDPDYTLPETLGDHYKEVLESCPELEFLPSTLRYSQSASHQKIGGIMYSNGKLVTSDIKEIIPVVDRLGTGDAFMAGIIYGLSQDWEAQKVLDFAVASSSFKHTISGDINLASLNEINAIMQGDLSALVKR